MPIEILFDWEKVKKSLDGNKLHADDIILLLLDAGKTTGKTILQKEVFLASKEVFRDLSGDLLYHPDQYGPYSKVVEDTTRILKYERKITVTSKGDGHSTYFIEERGKEQVKEICLRKNIPESKLAELKERKANWDEWNMAGIIRYVYRNYPEYATMTRVPMLKWEL